MKKVDLTGLAAYEVIRIEDLKDISSIGYILRHKKSGARLAIISNDDDNKVFSIGFRTTPTDETGVPHIIEHTTLCGSEKYPLKDPFVELVKGSLNTFLNAMTYPDKTIYPLASYNDQDFKNLMDVYLDAVFSPNLLKEEKIFRQEGWHYEMEDKDSPLTINGVVYNEMKGAYSSPDEILQSQIMKALFPDNTYSQNSGGNPEKIPTLTYENYVKFYHTFYHPSNSYVYLYGDMDVVERLEYLDREYLSKYDVLEMHTEIQAQKAFEKRVRVEEVYPIASDDSTEKQTYLSYNWVVGDALDAKGYIAMDMLDYALISAEGAPVKQALLDAGIGGDVYSSYEAGTRQSMFSIIAKGADPADEEKFVSIIENVLRDQAEKGLNKNSLLGAINSSEFRFREADFGRFPKGLMYGIQAMDSWLFADDQPFLHLECLDNFAALKKEIETGYFEKLLRERLLDNTHSAIVVLTPDPGKNTRDEKALADQLAQKKASLSPEEIETIIRETKELHAYQEAPEDSELLKCLPMLKRSDLRKEVTPFSNIVEEHDGVQYIRHDADTNGIVYLNYYFKADDLDADRMGDLGLLCSILGNVDTKHYSYLELTNAINMYTGGVNPRSAFTPRLDDPECLNIRFGVNIKVMEENLGKALELADEILYSSNLSDIKRIREIVGTIKARMQTDMSAAGNLTALTRALSYQSKYYYYLDQKNGIGAWPYICRIEKLIEENPDQLVDRLKELLSHLLSKKRLFISITGNEKLYKNVLPILETNVAKLPDTVEYYETKPFVPEKKNEGFTDASQIQYVCRAGNFKNHGYEFKGALRILKVILSYDYLWTNVRVKGGAYGCQCSFSLNGHTYFVSYRDPNLKKTVDTFEKIPDYVRNFNPDERELTGYIIGTFGDIDIPLTPEGKGRRSMDAYLMGRSEEDAQRVRTEILNASAEDIRALAPLMEAVLSDDCFCVVGNENAIQKDADMFMNVSKLCQ